MPSETGTQHCGAPPRQRDGPIKNRRRQVRLKAEILTWPLWISGVVVVIAVMSLLLKDADAAEACDDAATTTAMADRAHELANGLVRVGRVELLHGNDSSLYHHCALMLSRRNAGLLRVPGCHAEVQ